jgi:hypothetical protein
MGDSHDPAIVTSTKELGTPQSKPAYDDGAKEGALVQNLTPKDPPVSATTEPPGPTGKQPPASPPPEAADTKDPADSDPTKSARHADKRRRGTTRHRVPLAVRLIPAIVVVAGGGVASLVAATHHTKAPPVVYTTSTTSTTATSNGQSLTTGPASAGGTLETLPPTAKTPPATSSSATTSSAATTSASTTGATAKTPSSTGAAPGSTSGSGSPHSAFDFGSLYDNVPNVPLSCDSSGRCTGSQQASCLATNPSTCATTQTVVMQFTGTSVTVTDTYRTTITPSNDRTCHGTGNAQTGHPFPYTTWARGTWSSCVANVYSYPTEGWTSQAT